MSWSSNRNLFPSGDQVARRAQTKGSRELGNSCAGSVPSAFVRYKALPFAYTNFCPLGDQIPSRPSTYPARKSTQDRHHPKGHLHRKLDVIALAHQKLRPVRRNVQEYSI